MSSDYSFEDLEEADAVRSGSDDSLKSEQKQDERQYPTVGGYQVDDGEQRRRRDPEEQPPMAVCRFCDAEFHSHSSERLHSCGPRDLLEESTPDGLLPLLVPATHELSAFLLFDEPGLDAYWDMRDAFDEDLQDHLDPFEFEGDTWAVNPEKTKGWYGAFAVPDDQQDRNDADDETFLEFQVSLYSADPVEERKVTFTFRPSFPEARKTDGTLVGGFPTEAPEGVRVEFNSSNIDPTSVVQLLQRLAAELDVSPEYFEPGTTHEWSRSWQVGKYVRPRREHAERHLTGLGGLLERLSQFSLRSGGKGVHRWDDEQVSAHIEAVGLDAHSWSKMLPDSHLAKRLKCYHPYHVRSDDTDADEDELRDPKLELQFATGAVVDDEDAPWVGSQPIPWDSDDEFDVFDLVEEFDRTLLNCLEWAGLPVRADEDVYTSDQYFEVHEEPRDIDFVENPLDELAEREEDDVVRHLSVGSEGERAVVRALLEGSDGRHWSDLADEANVSRSTVYRAAETFQDIVRKAGGCFSLEDTVVREKLQGALSVFRDTAEWVSGQLDDLIGDDLDLEDNTPLQRWARTHGISIDRSRDGITVTVQGRHVDWYTLWKLLKSGVDAARQTGLQTLREFLEHSTVVYTDEDGTRVTNSTILRTNSNGTKAVVMGSHHGSAVAADAGAGALPPG